MPKYFLNDSASDLDDSTDAIGGKKAEETIDGAQSTWLHDYHKTAADIGHNWWTDAGIPGLADLPNGTYDFSLDVALMNG